MCGRLKCRFFASLLRFLFGDFAVAWARSGLCLLRFSSSFLAFSSWSLSVSLHPLRHFCAACSERVRSGRRACSVRAPFAPAPFRLSRAAFPSRLCALSRPGACFFSLPSIPPFPPFASPPFPGFSCGSPLFPPSRLFPVGIGLSKVPFLLYWSSACC